MASYYIHVGQTGLRLTVRTKTDITGALDTKILYKKPSGTTGEFDTNLLNESQGTFYYDIQNSTDLDEAGDWRFRSYVQFADGREAKGKPVQVTIYADEF